MCGPGSSVGIATDCGAGRSGIESRWGRDFPPVHAGPEAHPTSCKMGTGFFPEVKCGRGVLLTTRPVLVLRSWKSGAIKWVCGQKHNYVCLIRCYIVRSKKLHVAANSGHHQFFSFESVKIILYNRIQ